MSKKFWIVTLLFITIVLACAEPIAHPASNAQAPKASDPPPMQSVFLPLISTAPTSQCRFGIAARADSPGFTIDLGPTKIGGFIDWSDTPLRSLSGQVSYVHIIRVGVNYPYKEMTQTQIQANINARVVQYPHAIWQIGNEPDTRYENQDNATPVQYATQFYAVARALRNADPKAKIGFGTIVQPTPIRMRYLSQVWNELLRNHTLNEIDSLIDFWSIHSFILNEEYCPTFPNGCPWGAEVPPGFYSDYGDAIKITRFADTYSNAIFEQRIRSFRAFMKDKSQQNKPLWITEYGSLLPPQDPPGVNLVNVSDTDTANYMIGTFNFMRNTSDAAIGLPADGNRLVQRWFWYSLNDYRYRFGGSLYDPTTLTLTPVGQAFVNYVTPLRPEGGCLP